MSKENNVLKTLVKYRTCGTCKWWMRNIQGVPVVVVCGIIKDLLERWKCEADLQAIKEMIQQGTHVEIIEGDVDIIFFA